MPVSQLVYISRAVAQIDRAELFDITAVSIANNRGLGITGALVFCEGYFLQILEGPRDVIDLALERISLDPRHVDVQVIDRRYNVARSFAEWEMACLHEAAMTDSQAARAAARAAACAAMISRDDLVDRIGNDAHQLLVELRGAVAAESAWLKRPAA